MGGRAASPGEATKERGTREPGAPLSEADLKDFEDFKRDRGEVVMHFSGQPTVVKIITRNLPWSLSDIPTTSVPWRDRAWSSRAGNSSEKSMPREACRRAKGNFKQDQGEVITRGSSVQTKSTWRGN
ncbi:hypothetical protein MMC29_004180 [Sticta canariensis]|nr:hypothetical protein [Sticta canariensis]